MKAVSTISINEAGNNIVVDLILDQRLVSNLIYLVCSTRSNITFIVGQVSRYNSDPKAGYLWVVKQVFQYLKKIITLEIE